MKKVSKKTAIFVLSSIIVLCLSLFVFSSRPTAFADVTGTLSGDNYLLENSSHYDYKVDDTGSDNEAKALYESRIYNYNVATRISGELNNLKATVDFNFANVSNIKSGYIEVFLDDISKGTVNVNCASTAAQSVSINLGTVSYTRHSLTVRIYYRVEVSGFFDSDWADGYYEEYSTFLISEITNNYSQSLYGQKCVENNVYYFSSADNFNFDWNQNNYSSEISDDYFGVKPSAYAIITNKDTNISYSYYESVSASNLITQHKQDGIYELKFYTSNNTLIESYTFCIDSSAPTINVNGISFNNIYKKGVRVGCSSSSNEAPILYASYKRQDISFSDGQIKISDTVSETVNFTNSVQLTQSGYYTIDVIDYCFNSSKKQIMIIADNPIANNNELRLNKAYLKADNYQVQIPNLQNVTIPIQSKDGITSKYPGTYSNANIYYFASEENALAFMTEIIIASEVSATPSGYVYKQENNANAITTYSSSDKLRTVVKKYASNYVKAVGELTTTSDIYLSDNIIVLDDAVYNSSYKEGVTFIGKSFKFVNKTFSNGSYIYNSLNTLTIKKSNVIIYNGNITAKGFADYVGTSNGLFTITETDSLGYSYTYEVFYDVASPSIQAEYSYFQDGNEIQSSVNIITGLEIDNNLKSLIITKLFDNADSIITAEIRLPNENVVRTRDINMLQFGENLYFSDGGVYSVKVYDRSLNVFEYKFTIAGPLPKVNYSYTGSGDSKMLVLQFFNGSTYSSIVNFEIYRYDERIISSKEDEIYEEYIDGQLVNYQEVNSSKFTYELYRGGEYYVKFFDSFGRITTSDVIKFKKGLPSYTLTGVDDGGVTKDTVVLSFANNIGFIASLDGVESSIIASEINNTYKLEIPAVAVNNGKWYFELYMKSDEANKISVSFEIDTIAPVVNLYTVDGKPRVWNKCYNETLMLDWDINENVERCRYVLDNGYTYKYNKNQELVSDGVYEFTVFDAVGNSATYKMQIDKTVNYELSFSGNNITENNTVFVKNGFTITNNENLELTVVRDGEVIDSRFLLQYTNEGTYNVTLSDYMGNTVTIDIVIDRTAPLATITSLGDKYSPISVSVDVLDVSGCKLVFNSKVTPLELQNEMTFDAWGVYALTLSDKLGNSQVYNFEIFKVAPIIQAFTSDGVELENAETTNTGIYFKWDDASATAKIALNGFGAKAYTQNTLLTEEGVYTLTVTDDAKNKVAFVVTIVKTISYSFVTANNELLQTVMVDGIEKTKEAFTLQFNTALNVTVKKDNLDYSFSAGQQLTADGEYYFYIYDDVGNYEERTIVIDTQAPIVNYVQGSDLTAEVVVILNTDDVQSFVVSHKALATEKQALFIQEEYVFDAWGAYSITVSDALGNVSSIEFSISKTPPKITIRTVSGKVLTDKAKSCENFVIEYDEELIVKYAIDNNYNRVYKPEEILSAQGVYNITITDLAENVYNYSITLDSEVEFKVIVDATTIKDLSNVIVGKRYIEISLEEDLVATYSYNNSMDVKLTSSVNRLTEEGKYEFVFVDTVGNSKTIYCELDRTAPLAYIDTEDITKSDVVLTVDDVNDVSKYTVKKDGAILSKFVLNTANVFNEAGSYEIVLSDELDNKNSITFTIKRDIKYKLSVANGFVTDGQVTLSLKENNIVIKAKLNGENIELTNASEFVFSDVGKYEISLTDKVGNVVNLSFTLDKTEYRKSFVFNIPLDCRIKVDKDGAEIDIDKFIVDDVLTLTDDGEYYITFKKDNVTSVYSFTIDTVIPVLLLNGKEIPIGTDIGTIAYDFSIASSKSKSTITVYYNGDEVDYTVGDKLNAQGKYKVVIEDKVGNIVEYEFERAFTFNSGAIFLFVMLGVGVVIIIALIIRRRIKMKIT